jgi:hypothetical protein
MSEATAQAHAFVASHREEAAALGRRLAELVQEPEAFVWTLEEGLAALVDPAYTAMTERVSPEVPADLQVRGPLVEAVQRPIEQALREGASMSALQLAQRLVSDDRRAVRLFALPPLRRALAEDPEQAWQLMRQLGRGAGDWVEVDSLADLWARGVLAEPFRWSELEQLVYSLRPMERRLVGATLATIPHRVPSTRRTELGKVAGQRAMDVVGLLMGDAEVLVQKALSWALREWSRVAPEATASCLRTEAALAAETRDGARAWVVRDALASQPSDLAMDLRRQLDGIRRDGSAPSTSLAAQRAAGFAAALAETDDTMAAQGHRYTRSHA